MKVSRDRATILAVGMLLAVGVGVYGEPPAEKAAATDAIRDGYETGRTSWQQEYTDATVRLLAHDRSDRAAHGGRMSERFQFEAGMGSRFFVSEALPKIAVTEDLVASVYVRSNRPGAQIFGWVVLPGDIDPATRAPSYLLVPGDVVAQPDRWEKLQLAEMLPAIEEQARVLRASTRRPVSLEGAYLERVVVNLMGGTGETEVFLDDLRVAPVPKAVADAWIAGRTPQPRGEDPGEGQTRKITESKERGESDLPAFRLTRGVLERLVGGQRYVPWFPTAVEAPGADPVTLRQYGSDVLVTGPDPDVKRILPLVEGDKPMYLLPRLSPANEPGGPQRVLREISEYPLPRSVLLWWIGDRLGRQRRAEARAEEVDRVREVVAALDDSEDARRLVTATVDGQWRLYTRPPTNLDVVGVDLPMWGSSFSFTDGMAYVKQRRDIVTRSNLEALFWAWLPATAPTQITRNIWGTDPIPDWGTPTVQPEQLRIMTYAALASGCRGITFVGDADLTRPAGEPLLLEMGFLNAEIDLFEAILAGNIKRIADYPVLDPDPPERPTIPNMNQKRMPLLKELGGKAGMLASSIPLPGSKGALLLVVDYGINSQYQPGQLAYHDLVISTRLPRAVQFLEVSPGEARFLEQKADDRIPGGMRVNLPDFGVTTMILATTDMELCERIQRNVAGIRPLAVQWAIRQAEIQLAAAREGHERLKEGGHLINSEEELKKRGQRGIEDASHPPDAEALLAQAEEFLKTARTAYESQDYANAWAHARRATRPVRQLTYGYFTQAMAELQKAVEESLYGKKIVYLAGQVRRYPDPPVLLSASACPPGVSFATLPQFHLWKEWIQGMTGFRFGANRVPSGSFDNETAIKKGGWTDVSHQLDGVTHKISVIKREKAPLAPRRDAAKNDPTKVKKSDIKYEEEVVDPKDHVLKMTVKATDARKVDELDPYVDEPAAAILSPGVRVSANNLIRISVLVRQPYPAFGGRAGVIVRDSIGGEALQFRAAGPIAAYSRVVLYRKAPADGVVRVLLGLAGYGEVYFDDFRVQVIEDDIPYRPVDPGLAQGGAPSAESPGTPDPQPPAAALAPATRRDR